MVFLPGKINDLPVHEFLDTSVKGKDLIKPPIFPTLGHPSTVGTLGTDYHSLKGVKEKDWSLKGSSTIRLVQREKVNLTSI